MAVQVGKSLLQVWAIIVSAIIVSKLVYRWQATKQFAKEDQERRTKAISDGEIKDIRNNDVHDNRRYGSNMRTHKYSPSRYYKNYYAIKKNTEYIKMLFISPPRNQSMTTLRER